MNIFTVATRIEPVSLMRPPGALPELRFSETCPGCGDCLEVCPLQLIELDEMRLPEVECPEKCCHCGLCIDVCMFGALHHTPETRSGLDRLLAAERCCQPS